MRSGPSQPQNPSRIVRRFAALAAGAAAKFAGVGERNLELGAGGTSKMGEHKRIRPRRVG